MGKDALSAGEIALSRHFSGSETLVLEGARTPREVEAKQESKWSRG
jgi:hypothetical protein